MTLTEKLFVKRKTLTGPAGLILNTSVRSDPIAKEEGGRSLKPAIPKRLILFFSSIVLSIVSFAIGIHSFSYLLKRSLGHGPVYPNLGWLFLITGTVLLLCFIVLGFVIVFRDFGKAPQA